MNTADHHDPVEVETI